MTVSFTTAYPVSSMSKVTLERGLGPPGVSGGFVHADLGGPLGCEWADYLDRLAGLAAKSQHG